jgi:hypothetical protein
MRKLIFGLILALGVTVVPAAARADTVSDEADFVARINALRTSQGLPGFEVHPTLVAKARAWAQTMSEAGRIWHSTLSDGITVDWQKLGENVGMGGSVDGLHQAFVASPHHYANLVDDDFRYVGIGIAMSGNTMYVSEVFMKVMDPKRAPVVTPAPTTPAAPPAPATPHPTSPPKPIPAPRPAATPAANLQTMPKRTSAPVPPSAPVTAPAAEAPAPPSPTRAPSALLVSVLERLRTFDS